MRTPKAHAKNTSHSNGRNGNQLCPNDSEHIVRALLVDGMPRLKFPAAEVVFSHGSVIRKSLCTECGGER